MMTIINNDHYKTDISDYIDIIIKNEMEDCLIKIMDGILGIDDIANLNKHWVMNNKSTCYYYWMIADPKLNSVDEEVNKKKAWEMFPGLAINYNYKIFNWVVIPFGSYYILEASFPV